MSEALFRRVYNTIGLTSHKLGGVAFDDLTPEQHETFARSVAAAITGDLFNHPHQLMPCGHDVENLICGAGAVTKCGQCLADRQSMKATAPSRVESTDSIEHVLLRAGTYTCEGKVVMTITEDDILRMVEELAGNPHPTVLTASGWEAKSGRQIGEVVAGGRRSDEAGVYLSARVRWMDPAHPRDTRVLARFAIQVRGGPQHILGGTTEHTSVTWTPEPGFTAAPPTTGKVDPWAIEARDLVSTRRGVFISSKTKHAGTWQALRALGLPVISTWIDVPAGAKTTDETRHELWGRNIAEASGAAVLLAYHEPGELPKGALAEIGAALAAGVQVYWVGPSEGQTIVDHELVREVPTLEEALELVHARLAEAPTPTSLEAFRAHAAGFAEGRAEERAALLLLVRTERKGKTGGTAVALDTLEMVLERDLGAAIALGSARAAGAAEERNLAEVELSNLRTKLAHEEEMCSVYRDKWIGTMKWLRMPEPGDFDVKGRIEQLQRDAEGVEAARARWKAALEERAETMAAEFIWAGEDFIRILGERIYWKDDPRKLAASMRTWLASAIRRGVATTLR